IDKEFLDKLYGYSYKRCSTSHDAEDLCSDIILTLLKSIGKNPDIENFYAFAWTVANRAYADFCEKRKTKNEYFIKEEFSEDIINIEINPITDYVESETEESQLRRIKREIAFLSKIYRDVMIMYYLDEMKTADIAKTLGISETAVKQRLFSARNTIRKEVNSMDSSNLSLKPVRITFQGDGNPLAGEPGLKAYDRTFSQNVLYLCRDTERTAKEISEILNVPMLFAEEELEIQSKSSNGTDGLLQRLSDGNTNKYISTFIIMDYSHYKEINNFVKSRLDGFTDKMSAYIEKNKEKILGLPYLNEQKDLRFILWSLVTRMSWSMGWELDRIITDKFYKNSFNETKKPYYTFGIATEKDSDYEISMYGCDGIDADSVCGYSHIHLCNIYGKRKEAQFHCGKNIATDQQLLMTIKAIGGLDIKALTDDEKEAAAKAIEAGYLKKTGDILQPAIIVMDNEKVKEFYKIGDYFTDEVKEFASSLADEFNNYIIKYLPKHLYGQMNKFIEHSICGFTDDVVEKCIEKGILYVPEKMLCPEGTFMVVMK
ncbi:MAG: polymerase sigma factor, sigma-70 family, partial [Clostridia bacterium]|nr:polymerase sigma factor, sigma-70 family [Clostridia bacterium]